VFPSSRTAQCLLPVPAIICIRCKFTLQPSGASVSRHIADTHDVPVCDRRELASYVDTLRLHDPNTLQGREDGRKPHLHLLISTSAGCSHCNFHSKSVNVIQRHLPSNHMDAYAIMLPWNASHSRRSPKSPHVAHSICIASPKCAYLKLWLQIRNVPCSSSCRGTSQPPVTMEYASFTNRTRTSPCQQFRPLSCNTISMNKFNASCFSSCLSSHQFWYRAGLSINLRRTGGGFTWTPNLFYHRAD
jgi:hypothetical protein